MIPTTYCNFYTNYRSFICSYKSGAFISESYTLLNNRFYYNSDVNKVNKTKSYVCGCQFSKVDYYLVN